MFFRFVALLCVMTVLALVNLSLEKQSLSLKQQISSLHEELELLNEQRARLYLTTQQLSAPPRLYAASKELASAWGAKNPQSDSATSRQD